MLFLASRSPRRTEILSRLGFRFRVVPTSYCELRLKGLSPKALVLRHAVGKAKGARVPKHARFVLSADTIVWINGKFLGKPKTRREARRMLSLLSGKAHFVHSAVAIYDRRNQELWTGISVTKVFVKRLSSPLMRSYHKQVNPSDKAGAYAIQSGPRIVNRIEGSYTNVIGLPVELLKRMLDGLSEGI